MRERSWFSSKVRLVVITGAAGGLHYADSVFVFRAEGFEDAFGRALALGRKAEESYRNEAGDTVAWRLKEVLTLDAIKDEDLDGAEVAYQALDIAPGQVYALDTAFEPEKSEPVETF